MKTKVSATKNTFGHIYTKCFQLQLLNLGKNLSSIRESRNETVESVAKALKVLPGIIIGIENGKSRFQGEGAI